MPFRFLSCATDRRSPSRLSLVRSRPNRSDNHHPLSVHRAPSHLPSDNLAMSTAGNPADSAPLSVRSVQLHFPPASVNGDHEVLIGSGILADAGRVIRNILPEAR